MLETFAIMTDTQSTDVLTFDFKVTGLHFQMNIFLVQNVAKYSRFVMKIV